MVKFGTNGRTNGDIEALADARRALKNIKQQKSGGTSFAEKLANHFFRKTKSSLVYPKNEELRGLQ